MPAPLRLDIRPVCVTGGSGFIGGRLVERLAAMGFDDILVPVRRPATCSSVARFPVRLATVDLLDPAAVGPAVAGRSLIFHLAYGSDDQGRSVTIDGTKCVVEAAIAAQCDAVVVLSSMAVFGHPNGGTDESAAYRPSYGDYGRSKMRMEQWCVERSRTSGRTRIVVLNPSCVYGPAGPTYTELPATLAREGHFCWIDAGSGNANYVYVDNLVDAILL